jgi:phosphoheptose isomerase
MHCKVVALTGGDGGALAPLSDVALKAPSRVVARIQEVHDVWIHAIAQALEDHAMGPPA